MAREAERAWSRPELTVIARGKPEEVVLAACKTPDAAGGYAVYATRCSLGDGFGGCTGCEVVGQS